jgi:hypothetical protein
MDQVKVTGLFLTCCFAAFSLSPANRGEFRYEWAHNQWGPSPGGPTGNPANLVRATGCFRIEETAVLEPSGSSFLFRGWWPRAVGVQSMKTKVSVSSWVLSFLFRPIIGRGKRGKEREKEGEEARGN